MRYAVQLRFYVKKKSSKMLQDHSVKVRKTCDTCEKMSYISLGVLLLSCFDTCSILRYLAIFCKNINKCKTSVKTIPHQKGAAAIFFRYLGKTCGICGSVFTAVLGISGLVAMLTNN